MKRPRKPREGSESRAARRRLKAADGGRREQLAKRSPEGSCVGFRCGVSGSYMTAWLADCMR